MPLAGEFGFPKRPGWVPIGGNVLFDTGAVTARAAPAGPGFSLSRGTGGGEQAAQQNDEDNISIHEVQNSFWAECLTDCESVTVRTKYIKRLFQLWYYADDYPKCFIT